MNVSQHFERREDGVRLTSLVLATTVFFDSPISEHGPDLMAAWQAFCAWCPDGSRRFYSTETMSEHRPTTPKALGMLDAWFAPGAPPRDVYGWQIKDGKTFDDTPHWMFDLLGIDGDVEEPALIQIAVPYSTESAEAARLRAFTGALVTRLEASHAVAGVAMVCSPYEEEASQTFARARSMRHRGVDLLLREADRVTVGRDGIKGVNWLTYIDAARVERLGGAARLRAALDPGVGVTPVGSGLLLQSGDAPELGDENQQDRLPLYRSTFSALEPLTTAAFERSLELVLEDMDDAEDLSQAWRRRFAT